MSRPFYCINEIPDFTNLINNTAPTNSNINTVHYTTKSNQIYKIIRYDKKYLSNDLVQTVGLLRSVVLNANNYAISFAPPKSIPINTFMNLYPSKSENIVAEEFVEGTMINVFWDSSSGLSGAWEISTRNTVGGDIAFYNSSSTPSLHTTDKTKTFRSMFLDAVNEHNIDLNTLNPRFCYSFVLQHPYNRIVIPFKKTALYLVDVYEIVNTENGTINVFPADFNHVKADVNWRTTTLKFPTIYDNWYNYTDLKSTYASMNTPFNVVGVVIRNKETNERSKIRNPVYENIKHLRGNNPYQYLCLRQQGMVGDYLIVYPEHKHDFAVFRDNLHNFTHMLFQNYISCYIRKELQLTDVSSQFRTHMIHLHKLYMDTLKIKDDYITKVIVVDYVNKLHPKSQMHSLNYSMQKRRIEFLKADTILERHDVLSTAKYE